MPSFELRCLGTPLLVTASGEPVRFRTRKHFALLIRLAVEPGKKVSRDSLTDLLWPAAAPAKAAHSLSQALSVIRARLGREHIVVQRAGVALAEGALWVDVHRLETCDSQIRGGFLDGFDVPGARPFDDWKDEWRAKLTPRLRDCLVKQMDGGRRYGDFATVERHAQVLYELDPVSEDAVRGLIEARAWVGDRTNALKVYAAYAARLADELDAKPSAELQRMAELLREGRRPTRPRAVGEPPGRAEKRFEPETVIGREREFSALYDAWLAARRRAPRVMVVLGDPGLGKTTLVNAFVSSCQLEGAVVARAQAYDAERELPFAVLAELVRQLTDQRAIGCADPEALSELSRVCPEIFAAFPGVPKPVDWAPEVTPLRLADGFLKTITAAADESPVVLVVDDIHAADNASTAILHVVARKLPQARLLVILAARPGELRHAGAPAALTSDAMIEGLQTLDLDPLSPEASGELVERVAGEGGAPAGDVPKQRILDAGRGNPLALALLTREWVAHGPESLLRDLEAVNTQPVAAIGIPRAIKAVFDRQVARLDRKTRAVLDLAAVLGRRLADLSLYRAVDCTPIDAAEGLARLRDAGFVREIQGGVEFRNELIRAQAYYAVPGTVRQYLHRRVGELLKHETPSSAERAPLEVAWHFFRGRALQEGFEQVVAGAEGALAVGAPFEAEQVLTVALSEPWESQATTRLRLIMARALIGQSKAEPAVPVLATLENADPPLPPVEQAEVYGMQASAAFLIHRQGTHRHKVAAERAVRAAKATNDQQLIIRALYEYARAGVEGGLHEPLRDVYEEITLRLQHPPVQVLPMAHFTVAFCVYYLHHRPSVAASHLRRAVESLEGSHSVAELSLALNGLGVCHQELLECESAEEAFVRAHKLANGIADDSRCSIISANLCTLYTIQGRFEHAIEAGQRSIWYGKRAFNQPRLMHSYLNLAEAHMLAGAPEQSRVCHRHAARYLEEEFRWRARVEFLCETASLSMLERNVAEALDSISRAEHVAEGRGALLTPMLGFDRLRVFRALHTAGSEEARGIMEDSCDHYRDRNPLGYFEAIALRAWLEKEETGSASAQTTAALTAFENRPVQGRRALLVAQGFLPDVGPISGRTESITRLGRAPSADRMRNAPKIS